jgi:hypothetical protein
MSSATLKFRIFPNAKKADQDLIRDHRKEILRFWGPFRGWQPVLVPRLPDLPKRVQKALWWLTFEAPPGVPSRGQSIGWDHNKEAKELRSGTDAGFVPDSVWESTDPELLPDSLWDSIDRSLSMPGSEWEPLYTDTHVAINNSLHSSLWNSLWLSTIKYLGKKIMSIGRSFREPIQSSLLAMLFFPAVLVLMDDMQRANLFLPLIDLWKSGNYPIGIDSDGTVVVLVA